MGGRAPVVALAALTVTALAAVGGATGVPGASAADGPDRMVFTADTDTLAGVTVARTLASGDVHASHGVSGWAPTPAPADQTAHTGELSATTAGATFVSTVDDPTGEVYVALDDQDPVRVTCGNDAAETHPVLTADGDAVAYASDAAGQWDIWVLVLWDALDDGGSLTSCEDDPDAYQPRRVTTDPGADLWPSWTPTRQSIVFSSDRADPLGDLFEVPFTWEPTDPDADPEAGIVQLTSGPHADTQPAVMPGGFSSDETVIAFTTTRYRDDGSLATLTLSPFRDPAVRPFWTDPDDHTAPSPRTPQSTEAAWSRDGEELLFTTTDHDPYGDVHLTPVQIRFDPDDDSLLWWEGSTTATLPVAARPGRTETHGAFLTGYGEGSGDTRWADVGHTVRQHSADVADVVIADGTDRRTLAAGTYDDPDGPWPTDDAGPDTSPDGTRIVFARTLPDVDDGVGLFTAATDGTDEQPLGYEREQYDVDQDPVWSPDGTRVAFVRHADNGDGHDPPAVWVVDLATGTTRPVTAASEEDPETAPVRWESDPAWSPDGTRLAVSRIVHGPADLATTLTADPAGPYPPFRFVTLTTTVTASAPGHAELFVSVPAGLRLLDLPQDCRRRTTTDVLCDVGAVDAGQARVFPVTVQTDGPGLFTVRSWVFGAGPDPVRDNDSAEVVLDVRTGIDAAPGPGIDAVPGADGGPGGGLPGLDVAPGGGGGGPVIEGAMARSPARDDTPADGSDARPAVADTEAAGASQAPRMVPVAFSRATPQYPPPGRTVIWTMDADDGADAAPLVAVPPGCAATEPCPPVPVQGRSPAWSPDGTRLAFTRSGAVHVLTLAVDGAGAPAVPESVTAWSPVTGMTAGVPSPSRAVLSATHDPAWSSDGTMLAVAGQPAGQPDRSGIHVLAADGTGVRGLSQGRGADSEPVFPRRPVPPEVPPAADLAVTVAVDRPVGYVGGGPLTATVTVTNTGPDPAEGVSVTVAVPGFVTATPDAACPPAGACPIGVLAPGASRVLTSPLAPVAAGAGTVAATVTSTSADPVAANDSASVGVEVRQPTLRILPAVNRPGTVVLAFGEDFPPGAGVTLTWSVGITTQPHPFAVAADGTVRRPVLVVHRDRLGERTLTATSTDGSFGPVQAPLLVVADSFAPPEFLRRR